MEATVGMYGDLQGIAGKNTSGDRKVALLDLNCDVAVAPAPQMRPHRSILFDFVYEPQVIPLIMILGIEKTWIQLGLGRSYTYQFP